MCFPPGKRAHPLRRTSLPFGAPPTAVKMSSAFSLGQPWTSFTPCHASLLFGVPPPPGIVKCVFPSGKVRVLYAMQAYRLAPSRRRAMSSAFSHGQPWTSSIGCLASVPFGAPAHCCEMSSAVSLGQPCKLTTWCPPAAVKCQVCFPSDKHGHPSCRCAPTIWCVCLLGTLPLLPCGEWFSHPAWPSLGSRSRAPFPIFPCPDFVLFFRLVPLPPRMIARV